MAATAGTTNETTAPQRRRTSALRPVRGAEAGRTGRRAGRAAQDADPAPVPDLRLLNGTILRLDRPQFADLANAYLHAHGRGEASEEQRAQLLEALPRMLLAFEQEHGAIVRSHLTATLAAACLTERDELVVAIGQRAADGPANLVALLRRCERVGYTAWHRLHTYDRRSCQLQLWNVVMKNTDLRLIAALRPVVGLVTSLAVYVLVEGGIVPIATADDVAQRTALVTGIALLVGFSERLAQDVFIRSGNGLLGTMGDSPAKGPAAGLTPPPGARR